LFLVASLTPGAHAADPSRFSVGIPAEVELVGLGVGVHPELLYRPFQPDGGFHLRLAPGLALGPELAFVPVAASVRQVILPRKQVRPFVGMGVSLQTFLPYGAPAKVRLDNILEVGGDLRVSDGLRFGLALSPEFGMVGGFGLGMSARAGVQVDL